MKVPIPVKLDEIMATRRIRNADLARHAFMQPGTIGWIRSGRFIPYPSQLEKIADALGVDDPDSLLEPLDEATQ